MHGRHTRGGLGRLLRPHLRLSSPGIFGPFVGGLAAVLVLGFPGISPALSAGATSGTPSNATTQALVRIGQQPSVPSDAQSLGALTGNTTLRLDVVLRPRDPAALQEFITSVSDPTSPTFGQYLNQGQFGPQFGPSQTTITAVTKSLSGLGLHVGAPSPDRLLIPVSGSVKQISSSLHTSLHRFKFTDGRSVFANLTAPQLPSDIAGSIVEVTGLSDVTRKVPQLAHAPSAIARVPGATQQGSAIQPHTSGSTACSTASIEAVSFSAYTETAMAKAYGFTTAYASGHLGQGETIALYELGPHNVSDVSAFQSCFTLPGGDHYGSVTNVPLDGYSTTGTPTTPEAILDIDVVDGLAPEANVLVYEAPNSNIGAITEYEQIIAQDRAQVISTSWGACEAAASTTQTENEIFAEAAAQGQSIFAAAGDTGSEDCSPTKFLSLSVRNSLAVDDPASQPYVTGVGGTDMTTPGNGTSVPPTESVWNEKAISNGAGGGGVSQSWAKPSWQGVAGKPSPTGSCTVTPGSGSRTATCRQVPDVTATADPQHGDTVYCAICAGGWSVYGGTSAAAPLWAALASIANEGCGTSIGFLNPRLYQQRVGTLHDITSGTNDYLSKHPGNYVAGSGWDNASGWGSPNGSTFFSHACPSSVTTASLSRSSLVAGDSATYTVSFRTSATGTISTGQTITLTGPPNMEWSPAASAYRVNGFTPSSVRISFSGSSFTQNAVTITLSHPIGSNSTVTVTAGLARNSITTGLETLFITTTGDPGPAKVLLTNVTSPVSATHSSVSAAPSAVTLGQTSTVTVTLLSGFYAPIRTATVTLSAGGGSHATITPSSQVTNSAGVAAFKVSDPVAETVTFSATDSSAGVGINQTAQVTFAPPAGTRKVTGSLVSHIHGYWLVASDGGIFSFGNAPFFGSTGALHLNQPIVGMTPTLSGNGYWLVASDGGIFSFGDAAFFGSTGSIHLNKPIVAIARTSDGRGYWLVASDGGIFSFGDAAFFGSTGGSPLNSPIVGMTPTPSGNGYWLVASDGGIFSFGDAAFFGSTGGTHLNTPIVGIARTTDGRGYWLVASDGGIFSFGDAAFFGSTGGMHLNQPIVGMTPTLDGNGYELVASDGGIFSFGDAAFLGSTGGSPLNSPIVGVASTTS